MRRKEERSKQGLTNNKAKQHNTPKAVTFPKKNELHRVGLEPTTLYTLDRHVLAYHRDVSGIAVCLAVHTHSVYTQPLGRGEDSACYLTAIGDQQLVEELS